MDKRLRVEFIDTLMRWNDDLEFHVESGDRTCTYYFRVPAFWLADGDLVLQERIFSVAQRIYADFNEQLRENVPHDPNYLRLKATEAFPLSEAEERAAPWLDALNPSAWEWTPCVVAHEDGSYTKVDREEF